MWTKYNYLCTDCDAMIEITTQAYPVIDPACICRRSSHLVFLGTEETTDYADPVTEVTYTEVVQINTNPYTL
jgi:hypothetical protein